MSIRPIDLQISFARDNDMKTTRAKDAIHEEGAQRYSNELEKQQELKNENIQNLEETNLDKIKEEEEKEQGRKNKKKKKEEEEKMEKEKKLFSVPAKGSIIDIKFL